MTGKALCLLGPTGAGKTLAGLALAKAFSGSVINFDSRQVYQGLAVTTAQPTPEEAGQCPHLLYGFLDPAKAVTAGEFAALARQAMAQVRQAGRLPILVGGTGLYLRAILDGLAAIPAVDQAVRAGLSRDWQTLGPQAMHGRLLAVDPVYGGKIHPNDRQRILRALEVFLATGRPFSAWHAGGAEAYPGPCLKMGLCLDKKDLTARLARRIQAMMAAGALEEMEKAVSLCPDPMAPGLTGIGCAELAAHLRGEMTLDEALEAWLANTKAYAKRQMTWFKKMPEVRWFGPEQTQAMLEAAEQWLRS
jgi:tRNA dimethylallyltransferase